MRTHRIAFYFARCILLGSCVAMAGCGFHLQGQGFLPPQLKRVYVDYQAPHSVVPSPLLRNIKQVLRGYGATVTDGPDTAKSVLTLSPPEVINQFNSLTSSGSDKAYTLIVTGHYHLLIKSTGRESDGDITVAQSYSQNNSVAVARQEQVQRMLKTMQQDLAERMFLRIRAASISGLVEPTGSSPQ